MSHAEAIQENRAILQRCTTINSYVIDYLSAEDVIDEAQEHDLLTERNRLKQRILLFQWLKEGSSQKYESFLKVMKDTEQEHVANHLTGSTEEDHLPLSDARYERLRKIRHKMANVTRIDNEVIAELRKWKTISITDVDEITAEKVDFTKVSKLINAIMRRSNHSYKSFQVVLRDTLQASVANFLSEGEMLEVHLNNNRPDLDGILSSAVNEVIRNKSEGEKDIKELISEMNGFGVNLVKAIPGQSIVIFIYCRTVQNAVKFTQLFNSGRLQYILESILNRLRLTIEPSNKETLDSRIILEDDAVISLEEFTGIEDTVKTEKQGMNCEDKNRGCEEENDRVLKMQSEHKDQNRAWDEDKDRLLKIISEHEHLKRAWVDDKVRLLKVQNDLVAKLQSASSMREILWLLQRVILFIVWLFSLLDKRLSDVPNAIEEMNSGCIALKVFDSPQDQENIARLTLEQINRIIGMADIYPVQIEVKLSLKRIRVQGLPSQVTLVVSEIHKIFQEPHKKVITEKNDEGNVAQWEYENGNDFVKFRDEINAIIEKVYREKKPWAEWEDENAKYRLTFSTMVEECITQLGTPPVKVRRTCIAKDFPRDALPSTLALTDPVQKKIN